MDTFLYEFPMSSSTWYSYAIVIFRWQLSDVSSADGDVYLIGVALDGFPIFVTIEDGSVRIV